MDVSAGENLMEVEARRVIDAARAQGITLRLVGGVAIKLCCPSANGHRLAREYGDTDYVGYAREGIPIRRLFEELGYIGNKRFNAMQGRTRLMFVHPDKNIDVDIFLDVFQMCHKLNLSPRLQLDEYTLSLADLLLTKLQVVQLNEKDLKDIYSLLHDHSLGDGPAPETLDAGIVARLCADEWPWYRTVLNTIEKALETVGSYLDEIGRASCRERV